MKLISVHSWIQTNWKWLPYNWFTVFLVGKIGMDKLCCWIVSAILSQHSIVHYISARRWLLWEAAWCVLLSILLAVVADVVLYSRKFSNGAHFHIFHMKPRDTKIKAVKILRFEISTTSNLNVEVAMKRCRSTGTFSLWMTFQTLADACLHLLALQR